MSETVLELRNIPKIFPGEQVSYGILIAVAMSVLCWFFLYRTRWGYAIRMIGINQDFAKYSGMNVGGIIVLGIGCCLVGHYLSFGIFYDADSFILTAFGKKSLTYKFSQIRHQKLYMIQGGSIVVELHMTDGTAVSIHTSMEGAYPFLDHAFSAWCRLTGRDPEDCDFHDPSQSLWFPTVEVQ